jgi:hypothetical protein
MDDSLIADYVERLRHELQASPEETEEVLREVRSHLELAAGDVDREGGDEAARLHRALERFGAAARIGRELRQVHGRATWGEAGLTVLPLAFFGGLALVPQGAAWIAPLILGGATALGWRARWPLWWWAWVGWLPLAIPSATQDPLWGLLACLVILLLVLRRDWLEATLAIYPLPTAWAFRHVVLASNEVRSVGWSPWAVSLLSLGMTIVWAGLLARTLRTPPGVTRIARALEGQAIVLTLNGLTVVVARLWPTYPSPYPYTLQYFAFITLPYALFHGLPYLLFFMLTSLPAALSLLQARARRQPPSRPVMGG